METNQSQNGFSKAVQIKFTEDLLKGRIFWMGPATTAEFEPEIEYGFMNGNRYTFTVNNVRDKNGELVPDGTAVLKGLIGQSQSRFLF